MLFVIVVEWVVWFVEVYYVGCIYVEFIWFCCYLFLVVDEVGYILFEFEVVNFFF